MEDKVVLVTGSSMGIGEATVLEFAKLGCKVVVHGTNEERIKNVAQKCKELSPNNYEPLQTANDLDDETEVRKLLSKTIEHYGKLDVLVNNAAIFSKTNIDDDKAYELYKKMININLNSIVLLTTLAIPYLRKTKGNIINISSNLHCKVLQDTWGYAATKGALISLTKSIAGDVAPDIRVNSVSPGPVATNISGMSKQQYRDNVGKFCLTERIGESPEIARMIVFLSSPESSFITGSDFIIDGGATIKP